MMLRAVRLLGLVALAVLSSACAMRNPANRPFTTRVGETMMPTTVPGIIISSPIILPVGAAAFAADALVYHPATKADDAWRDTKRACWRSFGQEGRFVSDCGSLPVRTVGMPVVFLLDWGIRIADDVPPSPKDKEDEVEMGTFPFAVHE